MDQKAETVGKNLVLYAADYQEPICLLLGAESVVGRHCARAPCVSGVVYGVGLA